MDRFFAAFAHRVAGWAGQPLSFILAALVVVTWGITGPLFQYSDTWQLVINTGTTIITFLMVFLIQNAQNRDGSAMQAKLDELIRVMADARNEFIGIEHFTEAQLNEVKAVLEAECGQDDDHHKRSLATLIERR